MSIYRGGLPQLSDGLFLTDGGLETDLIFRHGVDLPFGAAYALLKDEAGVARLYRGFLERLPHISVLGGCCGTDTRHVRQIAEACAAH
jgi:S-methylmethionine-dependent homocysteine/selenocysteine methylase